MYKGIPQSLQARKAVKIWFNFLCMIFAARIEFMQKAQIWLIVIFRQFFKFLKFSTNTIKTTFMQKIVSHKYPSFCMLTPTIDVLQGRKALFPQISQLLHWPRPLQFNGAAPMQKLLGVNSYSFST